MRFRRRARQLGAVHGRASVNHCAVKLVDHLTARNYRRRQRIALYFVIAVNYHAIGQWTQIGALAARDDEAEMLMMRSSRCHPDAKRRVLLLPSAISTLAFELCFLLFRVHVGEQTPRVPVARRVDRSSHLIDATAEFVGIEMCVAAVGERCKYAAVEVQQRGVRAFGGARSVPCTGRRANRTSRSAGEQSRDIDLMRRLAEHDAAAFARRQFLRTPWPVQKI